MRAWEDTCVWERDKMSLKRGQEEIVGFVLVVLLVCVAGLVFLGIFIRGGGQTGEQESVDIYQFLESAMKQTTECAIGYEPDFSDLGELIEQCRSGKICISGESACAVLNESLTEMLEKSWMVGPDRPIKGYVFNSSYGVETNSEEIVSVMSGECKGSIRGAEYLSPSFPGNIISTLKICFD